MMMMKSSSLPSVFTDSDYIQFHTQVRPTTSVTLPPRTLQCFKYQIPHQQILSMSQFYFL